MKISVVTVAFNSQDTIHDTINSVYAQDYENIEYIIIDGESTDNTLEIIKDCKNIFRASNKEYVFISEKDKGIYDAINKGINLSTGDIVGILNSDDCFHDSNVVSNIVEEFAKGDIDCLYGNLVYMDSDKKSVIRTWISREFTPGLFKKSWTPAHPTFYCRRNKYSELGLYRTDFKIASDVELMYRYLELNKIKSKYINRIMVVMRMGGVSTKGIGSTAVITKEMLKVFKENNDRINIIEYLFYKSLKILEFTRKGDTL